MDEKHPSIVPLSMSLVIPTYNRANLIGETLESALNQSRQFAEIIVVDDGSTDNTKHVLAEFGDHIKVIKSVNQGVQAARNLGVILSNTDLVALIDSDDLLERDFCHDVSSWMARHLKIDILYCNFVNFNGDWTSKDKFSYAPRNFFDGSNKDGFFNLNIPQLYKKSLDFQPLFSSGVAFKRDYYFRIGGYDTRFRDVGSEDWEFTLRAISMGEVALCSKVLTRIRRHDGNDSSNIIHMLLGESKVLEFGLNNHLNATKYKSEILKSIHMRRVNAFHCAFSDEKLDLASDIDHLINRSPLYLKYQVKRFILKLPLFIRNLIWKFLVSKACNHPLK